MNEKPKLVTRAVTLKASLAGVAAEMRVAAELCRHGFHVARPYWNEDEIDLLVAYEVSNQVVSIPIQVKCVQFKSSTKRAQDPVYFIQNLKRRYVDGKRWLSLALYNPQNDWFWFIDGAVNIRAAYNSQRFWRRHIPYRKLRRQDDVRIGLSRKGRGDFDRRWKCPQKAAIFWDQRIASIAKKIADNPKTVAGIKAEMGW